MNCLKQTGNRSHVCTNINSAMKHFIFYIAMFNYVTLSEALTNYLLSANWSCKIFILAMSDVIKDKKVIYNVINV